MFEKIFALIIGGLYGAFGSIVHYLYEIVRDDNRDFSFGIFVVNGILGFFIGQVAGSFIPETFAYKDGILLISGFLVYQILDFIESHGLSLLLKKIRNK